MIELVCKSVWFYSQCDEDAFFQWISKIKGIKEWEGVWDEVHLYLQRRRVSQTCMRELTALFRRYNIDTEQLRQLVNNKNARYTDKGGWDRKMRKNVWPQPGEEAPPM